MIPSLPVFFPQEQGVQYVQANILLWYLMGATEGNRETPISTEEVEEMLAKL